VIGKTIRQIMPEIEANWRVDTYSPVALDGIPVHIESYSVFLNHWYEVYAHQTTPGQFALFFTDITERKDTEEKLRQLSYFPEEDPNPVVRCTPEGSIMYTNVPAVNWLATFDRQASDPASLPEPLREAVAISESHRTKNLIRSLQDFNRPSSGNKTLMDMHASIDSLLLLCKGDFKRKGISTVLNYAERLPQILAISDQIKQVILNLLNNAADACIKPDRVITITTWQEKNSIAMAIKDNGIGIKPEEIDLIFQPFHSTKSVVKGTGLGLSICHGIVQNHHGEIRVESQPGEGSIFTVLLPIEEG
jgi:signal transduction histidine kinase